MSGRQFPSSSQPRVQLHSSGHGSGGMVIGSNVVVDGSLVVDAEGNPDPVTAKNKLSFQRKPTWKTLLPN